MGVIRLIKKAVSFVIQSTWLLLFIQDIRKDIPNAHRFRSNDKYDEKSTGRFNGDDEQTEKDNNQSKLRTDTTRRCLFYVNFLIRK